MTEISRDELEEMGFGDMLDAQPEPGFLSVIMQWYPTLPHKARQGMSLANLHDLSKQLTALNEARSEGRKAADTALQAEVERLQRLVYVPGVTRCAKCGLKLVSSTLNAHSGAISANSEPQACPNGCGPMWRVTERDAGNELCDRLDAASDRDTALSERVAELERGLEALVDHYSRWSSYPYRERHLEAARALLHPSEGEAGT
jgi:hypothetical protein